MYKKHIASFSQIAVNKKELLKNNPKIYFILSMLAGIYVGFGGILAFTMGAYLTAGNSPFAKIGIGFGFCLGLSFVVKAGSEMFTGNNMVMVIGLHNKKVTFTDLIKVWTACWIGNFIGAIILSVLYISSGLADGFVGEFIAASTLTKASLTPIELIARGLLCNMLVCAGVWCCDRMQTETGKLVMIFWCIFGFVVSGFENSVANMTVMTIGMLNPLSVTIPLSGYLSNMIFVTIGNIIGGAFFIGIPYSISSTLENN